ARHHRAQGDGGEARGDERARPAHRPGRLQRAAAQRSRRNVAASFGSRSRVKTPLRFSEPARNVPWAVRKSASAQTWVPTTKLRWSITSRYAFRNATWNSSDHMSPSAL